MVDEGYEDVYTEKPCESNGAITQIQKNNTPSKAKKIIIHKTRSVLKTPGLSENLEYFWN